MFLRRSAKQFRMLPVADAGTRWIGSRTEGCCHRRFVFLVFLNVQWLLWHETPCSFGGACWSPNEASFVVARGAMECSLRQVQLSTGSEAAWRAASFGNAQLAFAGGFQPRLASPPWFDDTAASAARYAGPLVSLIAQGSQLGFAWSPASGARHASGARCIGRPFDCSNSLAGVRVLHADCREQQAGKQRHEGKARQPAARRELGRGGAGAAGRPTGCIQRGAAKQRHAEIKRLFPAALSYGGNSLLDARAPQPPQVVAFELLATGATSIVERHLPGHRHEAP